MFRSQKGISVVTAIFIITVIAIVGTILAVQVITQSEETGNEYLSTQALYYAESGAYSAMIDIYTNNSLTQSTYDFGNGRANLTVSQNGNLWIIESEGICGDTSTEKYARRKLRVIYRH
ncbi:MSHA biogenesis protein MshP [Thermotomaculum hydrothermale]|uniref:MSHA biogenesis protein MshP n=1 Tax=Thermotomaculum hydrothermale TaxID=981385 RepID=A0A7R6PZU2_9BACT|nr:pilus assembly PilX N-terminal domain-containing protein [Thermotomaculum hydrothermale]BBB32863.1 MSHA biogenesis protein MshP [Thermotomaculum hydrothermale]